MVTNILKSVKYDSENHKGFSTKNHEKIATRLLLPHKEEHIEFSGNLYWHIPTPSQKMIYDSLQSLTERGYFASPFPEGDGITFSHKSKTLVQVYNDIKLAFDWSDVELQDNPQSKILLAELKKYEPRPGSFYYKVCDKDFFEKDGVAHVKISGPDFLTGSIYSATILKSEFDLIESGEHFQVALKKTNASDREFLISGISNNNIFKEAQENPDEDYDADELPF